MLYAKRFDITYVELDSLCGELDECARRCQLQAEGAETEVTRIFCEAQADAINAFCFYLRNSNPFKEDKR